MAKLLRGYKKKGDKYVTRSGVEISRREYDNRAARSGGWRNQYEYEKFVRSQSWKGEAFDIRRNDIREGRKPRTFSNRDPLVRDAFEVRREKRELGRISRPPGVKKKLTALGRLQLARGIGEPDEEWPDSG